VERGPKLKSNALDFGSDSQSRSGSLVLSFVILLFVIQF